MTSVDQQNAALPAPQKILLYGVLTVVLLILANLALTVLGICALFQFLWMLFTRERNALIAEFGGQLANWLAIAARFISGASDEKPFPWTPWR